MRIGFNEKIRSKSSGYRIIFIVAAIVLLAGIVMVLLWAKESSSMRIAELCRIIAVCEKGSEKEFDVEEGYWYTPYIEYVESRGILDGIKGSLMVRRSDMKKIVKYYGLDEEYRGGMSRKNILEYICANSAQMWGEGLLSELETSVVGIYENTGNSYYQRVCTGDGDYIFNGINMDKYIYSRVQLYAYSNVVLAVKEKVSDDIYLKNVYIEGYAEKMLSVNMYGIKDEFNAAITEGVTSAIADIEMKKGRPVTVNIKKETISGKVLSVGKGYIEVEGYGKVVVDEDFVLYDICDDYVVRDSKGIVVGYNLSEFSVAGGCIVGAVVNKEFEADNIRVLIKTTGYKENLHDYIEITCDDDFFVEDNGRVTEYKPNDIVVFKDGTLPADTRVKIYSDNNAALRLLNVRRSQGNPEYEGSMEILRAADGYAIINDINIEKYLKRVVPSEMPVSFGVEALKVQAVCARSYAYRHIQSGGYPEYGAHVDDSTQYQVYNNTNEAPESNEAIYCTKGQVITYGNEIVQAYYYSTSCGVGTDVSLWGSDAEAHPMYESRDISENERGLDYTVEDNFRTFIKQSYEEDYDSSFGYYRWSVTRSRQVFSDNFNEKLSELVQTMPERITMLSEGEKVLGGETLSGDGEAPEDKNQPVSDIGTVTKISVKERVAGGAALYIEAEGEKGSVGIYSENAIRKIFGYYDADIDTNNGTAHKDMLPSSFIIFDTITDEKEDYIKITGGGYGHGIGMSQNAVSVMVKKGMDYEQILKFFYPHTELSVKSETS